MIQVKPLSLIPDDEDLALHLKNCDTELVTRRLGELVPLLKFVGFQVEHMSAEKTVLSVPLLESAMNQNGTHQAAVFYLVADYTLGVGMFGAVAGLYTIGVHDRCRALPVQFWLKRGQVTHLAPGTGTIRAEVALAPETVQSLREQMVTKGRCLVKETVNIYQGDRLIALAEHEMGMYADLPLANDRRTSAIQIERMKASAMMIAGLRNDDLSTALAGEQGIAIARRMTRATPQLPSLVQARGEHARRQLRHGNFSQILVLGVGLDPKPVEFAQDGRRWFLVDQQEMLQERNRRLAEASASPTDAITIPLDLRVTAWSEQVVAAGFDPELPTLIYFEGVSMYLGRDDLTRTFSEIRKLCQNRASRLWIDHVVEDIFDMQESEVRSFLDNMARLGEPFVTGFDDPVVFAGSSDWAGVEKVSAAQIIASDDHVVSKYMFSVVAPN